MLHSHPLDVGECMWVSIPPEVPDELIGVLCVEQQVVGISLLRQTIHLLPVGALIAVFGEANHCGVTCRLNDGVETMNRLAVMAEEGTHHTALWYTGVHGNDRHDCLPNGLIKRKFSKNV